MIQCLCHGAKQIDSPQSLLLKRSLALRFMATLNIKREPIYCNGLTWRKSSTRITSNVRCWRTAIFTNNFHLASQRKPSLKKLTRCSKLSRGRNMWRFLRRFRCTKTMGRGALFLFPIRCPLRQLSMCFRQTGRYVASSPIAAILNQISLSFWNTKIPQVKRLKESSLTQNVKGIAWVSLATFFTAYEKGSSSRWDVPISSLWTSPRFMIRYTLILSRGPCVAKSLRSDGIRWWRTKRIRSIRSWNPNTMIKRISSIVLSGEWRATRLMALWRVLFYRVFSLKCFCAESIMYCASERVLFSRDMWMIIPFISTLKLKRNEV